MSRRKRFIEKLTEEQKCSLEKGYRTGKHFIFRRRCHCILLSHQGKSIDDLSKFFNVGRLSISNWMNLWEIQGLKGLELKPGRGRPVKLSTDNDKQVSTVKKLVENEPKNLNRVVSQVKSELGLELSKKTLKRFLKNLNTDGSVFAED